MEFAFAILYAILGYWAIGQTLYSRYICVGTLSNLFITRLILGCLFGIVLIPVALKKQIIKNA